MSKRLWSLMVGSVATFLMAAPAYSDNGQHGAGVNWSGSHGGVNWDGGHPYAGVAYDGSPATSTADGYPRRAPYVVRRSDQLTPKSAVRESRRRDSETERRSRPSYERR